MAIDPSIPLQVKIPQMQDPLEQYGRVQALKANQLTMQEGQRKIQTQNALRNLYAAGGDPNSKEFVRQMYVIDPTTAVQFQKTQGELRKTDLEARKTEHELRMRKLAALSGNPSDEAVKAEVEESVAQGLMTPEAGNALLQRVLPMSLSDRAKLFLDTATDANTKYTGGITREGHLNQANIAAANRANQSNIAALNRANQLNIARQPKYVEGVGMVSTDGRVAPVVGANGKALTAEQVAAAKARGTALGKQQAAAPGAIATAKEGIRKIDELLAHPGFKTVGLNFFGRHIPGTPSSDFKIRHEEVTGQAFMQAYETLKGAGQITEGEGEKATAAITRLNLSQSEAEYKRAAREFQDVLRAGIKRAEQNLGKNSAGTVVNFNDLK